MITSSSEMKSIKFTIFRFSLIKLKLSSYIDFVKI